MAGAAPHDGDLSARLRGHRVVALEQLGIAHDRVQRRAQFMAEADHVAALGEVRGLGGILGALQRRVRALVRVDLLHQEVGLPQHLVLRRAPADLDKHEQPAADADDDEQREEHLPQRGDQKRVVDAMVGADLQADQREDERHQHAGQAEGEREGDDVRPDPPPVARGQHAGERTLELLVHASVWLAHVVAARIERAAERADRPGVGGARCRVLALELVLADAAPHQGPVGRGRRGLAGEVESTARRQRDQRRAGERRAEREERRQRAGHVAEGADLRERGDPRCDRHRADADRVDVVEMRALELDAGRTEAERLVDDEIGDERADPGDGDARVERERALQRLVDAELHHQERDRDVEDQPDDAAGMRVREAREEVRPCDRAGIGVGDVDLELADGDEEAGQQQRAGARLGATSASNALMYMRGGSAAASRATP